MLILSRKPQQTIHIGEGIEIKVLRVGRRTVKIGIEAPSHVHVLRGELAEEDKSTPPRLDQIGFLDVGGESFPANYSDQYPHAV